MKPVNFITPVPLHQQNTITRWYRLSCIAVWSTLGILLIIQGWQLYKLFTQRAQTLHARSQCTQLKEFHEQLINLKNNTHAANEKLVPMRAIKERYKNLRTTLVNLINLCSTPVALLNCSLNNQELSMSLHCPSVNHALQITEKLRNVAWLADVHIVSLERTHKEKQLFLAHITGNLVA